MFGSVYTALYTRFVVGLKLPKCFLFPFFHGNSLWKFVCLPWFPVATHWDGSPLSFHVFITIGFDFPDVINTALLWINLSSVWRPTIPFSTTCTSRLAVCDPKTLTSNITGDPHWRSTSGFIKKLSSHMSNISLSDWSHAESFKMAQILNPHLGCSWVPLKYFDMVFSL